MVSLAREKFIVLDVEGQSSCRPYNVGYIIADRTGKIYKKRSIALPECFFENLNDAIRTGICVEMHHKNIEEITADFNALKCKRKYLSLGINEFFKMFEKDVKKNNIKKMYAYNITFDRCALERLFGDRFNDFNFDFRDIVTGVLNTRLLTIKYLNFCKENNYITDKGNFQYKAEIVYRYLTGLKDFIEEHTGLSDVLIEYEILLSVFKTRKYTNWKPTQAWLILKKFADKNNFI